MDRDIARVLITEEQIRERICQLGQELSRDYEGKDPIVLGVLKGVVVFYADMIRSISVPCEMDFLTISSYQGTGPVGRPELKQGLSANIKGRHVLILEDIFDTGNSLQFVYEHLEARDPASIRICTLLDKPSRRKPGITVKADYVGFTIEDAFVVGYGLDYNEKYRNLPYVGILKPEIYI